MSAQPPEPPYPMPAPDARAWVKSFRFWYHNIYLGNGKGGPGYTVDEAPPKNLSYTRGIVAMAKTTADPPGRSGSQFFIVTGPDAGLSPDYALLGRVSDGLDVVEKIGGLGTPTQVPKQTVLIDKVTIENG